jgi:hypothetical protein
MTKHIKNSRLLLLLFFLLVSVSGIVFAQLPSPTFNSFNSQIYELEIEFSKSFEKKDFKQAEVFLKNILVLAETVLPSGPNVLELEASLEDIKANAYYYLACSQAQLNNKKEAINSLEKAVEFGYSKYQHAKKDSNLDNIRKDKNFITLLDTIKMHDKLIALQKSGAYQHDSNCFLFKFNYQLSNSPGLNDIKTYFDLESVAGNGDEISKIKNLLFFVTQIVKYNGSNWGVCEFNAIDIYNYCQATGMGVNCRNKAMMLNEMYLAMGFKSRYVTCMPKDFKKDPYNHVINCVYSETLKKWLYMDPSFGIYVTDEIGNMLSISEVRERLKNDLPLALNKETEHKKEWYLDEYMARNLYQLKCFNISRFNTESRYKEWDKDLLFITLLPIDYDKSNPYIQGDIVTHDSDCFWLPPEEE